MTENELNNSLLTEFYKEIPEDATLGKALSMFENSTDLLVVTDKKNVYSGVLIERSILRTDLDPGKSKVKSFKTSAPKVHASTEITECARLMIENNLLYLPVFEKDKIKGIISYTDVLRSPKLQKMAKHSVNEIITKSPPTATPDDKISVIYSKFKKFDLFSLPVVEDGRFIGTVNLHDTVNSIIQHKEKPDFGTKIGQKEHLLDLPIRNIMTRPAKYVPEDATLGRIINIIIRNKLDCIYIIDRDKNLISVITVKDLLKIVAEQDEIILLPKIRINSDLEALDRNMVRIVLNDFVNKFSSILSQSEVEVYMREHREKHKDQKLIYTRIQILAHRERFDATAEGWGEDHSLKDALSKLERQIKKKKGSRKHIGKRT